MNEIRKKIWITGASSGIGKELALKFADKGWNVAVSARRKNLLEKLKTDLITILINLTIIQKKNEEKDTVNKTKKINILDNPNCLLLKKKGEKISRNDRCEATGKKFKQCCGAL